MPWLKGLVFAAQFALKESLRATLVASAMRMRAAG